MRVLEDYACRPGNLRHGIRRRISIARNVLRAREAAIDFGVRSLRQYRLGIPQGSRDGVAMLSEAGLLDGALAEPMMRMVGFRDVAVHDYRSLNLDILEVFVEKRLDNFLASRRGRCEPSPDHCNGPVQVPHLDP